MVWPRPVTTTSVCKARFAISRHVFHHWHLSGMWRWWCISFIFGWGILNFQTIMSLGAVRHLPPHWRLGWWTWWGATRCLHLLGAYLAIWWCEGVALHMDSSSRLLIIQVTWSGGHWHRTVNCKLKLLVQRPIQKNEEMTGLVLATSNSWWVRDPFNHHQWTSLQTWRTLLTWQ